jgi:hypothetical protein
MGVSRFGMKSFRDIISLFGSPDKLAKEIGVGIHGARNWRVRDSIPPEYWLDIIRAAKRIGHTITTDDLAHIAVEVERRKDREKAA